jgi:hypothetical protein
MRITSSTRTLIVSGFALGSACAHPTRNAGRQLGPAPATQTVVTTDIDTFWAAYDSARTTTDSVTQERIVQTRYIDRGSPGVRAFMVAKGYAADDWVGAIRLYPKFWASIRANTYRVKDAAPEFAPALGRLRALYPALRPATIYVTVGALQSGGTTQDSAVLIGAELVGGTPETDISEFDPQMHAFLSRVFGTRPLTTLVLLNVHEYVHTQQRGIGPTVLSRAIREGSADFVTELVTGTRIPLPYMTYGPAREPALRETFKVQMFTPLIRNWFYNQTSTDSGHVPDLGYYMGYVIARAYYQRAPDKREAVREMIELPFDDEAAVEAFLTRSGYFPEGVNKAALLRAYELRRPEVARVVPTVSEGGVDPRTTVIRVEFSAPMAAATGVGFGLGGKSHWPITGRDGFAPDRRSYTFRVALKPGQTYGFVLEGSADGGFRSADGFPLKPDTVQFTTRSAP